jgi:hypothetical protein
MPTKNALARAARFREAQATLTPDELEEQQRQNRTPSERPIAHTYAYLLRTAVTWFSEFMEDQHPKVANVELSFFTEGAPLSGLTLLGEYARYLVRSRVGRINEKLSVSTVLSYMNCVISVMKRRCRHSNAAIQDTQHEIRKFVQYHLRSQEGITSEMQIKSVAHADDVTFILSKLYEPTYLNSFGSMRVVLNLTLFILLVIDLCGRGGEIAHNHLRPKHMCLRWEDMDFYAFRRDEDQSIDIRANVTLKWCKGVSLDESNYKVIPFAGLLPASLALEDSLRHLINLAIMDGVFASRIKTWADLFKLPLPMDAGKTGRRIAMNPAMAKKPVLRRIVRHRISDDPVQTGDLALEIHRLGIYCGFENRLITYCFRRGVAYILALKTVDTTRRFLMGHSNDSAYKPYQPKYLLLTSHPCTATWRHDLYSYNQEFP